MMAGRVFRVIVDGRGLDLLNAFARASAQDWAALIGATGRNPFEINKRLTEIDKLRAVSDEERENMLCGAVGGRMLETVADLVFLARRRDGDREPGTDRPLTYETSCAQTPAMETLGALTLAMAQTKAAQGGETRADPTRARTVSVPGGKRQKGKRGGRTT